MKLVDHARLVQALQDTSILVAHNMDSEKQNDAARSLQRSISLLLGELKRDRCDYLTAAQPSVGIPD